MPFSLSDIFDFGKEVIKESIPSLVTGGAALLGQRESLKADEADEKTLQERLEEAKALQDLEIEGKKKLKELGLLGGGGGGGRQPVNPSAWRDAQAQQVQTKLAQAQMFKELADQMAGRLNQAILSRRR